MTFDEWITYSKNDNPSFRYWYCVLEFQITIHMFILSLRTGDFRLFIGCLERFCPIFFAIDHTNYARWISVFVKELKLLKVKDITLFNEFLSGSFSVKYSDGQFSGVGYDQAHEMNNKRMKSKSGFGDLFNNEDSNSLRKLEVVAPEIDYYMCLMEDGEGEKKDRKHKEGTHTFCLKFAKDCSSIYNNVTTNPFIETCLTKFNTTLIFPDNVTKDMDNVFCVGKRQYEEFQEKRFTLGELDIMDKISTNNLLLPSVPQRSKDGVIVMKLSNANMIRLRSASFMRESGSMQLFKHDFTGWSSVYYVRNNHKLMFV